MESSIVDIVCPFGLGEIAVFESSFRFEVYISRVMEIHIENWGKGWLPNIRKATIEEKRRWFESGEHELILEAL